MKHVNFINIEEEPMPIDFAAIESDLGFVFPEDYKAFVTTYNGGCLSSGVFYRGERELLGFLTVSKDREFGLLREC